MDALELMTTMVESTGKSIYAISQSMGRTNQYLYTTIGRGSYPKVNIYAEIADACGYDLIVRSRENDDEFIIDPSRKE